MTPQPPKADIEAIRAIDQDESDISRNMRLTAPKHIFLNVGPDDSHEPPGDFNDLDLSEVTWCEDHQENCDVEYVRADLASTLCDELESLRIQLADMDAKLYKAIDERADVYREICSLNTQYEQLEEQEKEVIEERDALRAEVERLREQIAKGSSFMGEALNSENGTYKP